MKQYFEKNTIDGIKINMFKHFTNKLFVFHSYSTNHSICKALVC